MLRMLALVLLLAQEAPSNEDLGTFQRGPLALLTGGPWMTAREREEALGDALMVLALASDPGERRTDLARKADGIFASLATRIGSFAMDEELLRLLWKRARVLAEIDPQQLARFFDNTTKRGYAPGWDADGNGRSRWGWRDRLEKLRPKR